MTDDHVLSGSAARALALGAALKLVRARQGWSVEAAANEAGLGHMTLRRAEAGEHVRAATYTALEHLLGVSFGTLRQALGDDTRMVQLLASLNIGFTHAEGASPAAEIAEFATAVLDQEATRPAVRARLHRVVVRDPHPGEAEAMTGSTRQAPPDSDLALASRLVERMTRRPRSARLDAAVDALLAAMTDLVDRRPDGE